MSAYEYSERYVMWKMKGDHTVKLSHVIASAGGMKKQGGARFTERDFDPFAKPQTAESPDAIDEKLTQVFSKASKAK